VIKVTWPKPEHDFQVELSNLRKTNPSWDSIGGGSTRPFVFKNLEDVTIDLDTFGKEKTRR